MSWITAFLYLLVFGFPLYLILIQWAYIRLRFPWLGVLCSSLMILVVVLLSFWVSKAPINCNLFVDCSWDGLGLLVINGYAFLALIFSTGAGFLIKSIYQGKVWKPGQKIRTTGKIPSFLVLGAIVALMSYAGWILKHFRLI